MSVTTKDSTLCVDLDGTLIRTDLLWESIFILLGTSPFVFFLLPFWLMRGKAGFKKEVADRLPIDAETLPYCQEFLQFLREEKSRGRVLILATASDVRYANAVAGHLGIFDGVLATQSDRNCCGTTKLQMIQEIVGPRFSYAGNSAADLPLWEVAEDCYVVNASQSVQARLESCKQPKKAFADADSRLKSILRLLRPVQWAKNLLLFVPLLLAHRVELMDWLTIGFVFAAFSACASGTYILNDLTDIQSDRRHHRKCRRPLASGSVSVPVAVMISMSLILGAIGVSAATGPPVIPGLLLCYCISTILYSHVLKNKVFIDVLTLAGLYTFRILAGGVCVGIEISHWLLAFSVFLFLSLALAKRYAELAPISLQTEINKRRGYRTTDLVLLGNLGPTCGYMACLVLLLYVSSAEAISHYSNPELLYLIAPLYLYWITRIWFLASRLELSDDPVVFAVKDLHTYIIALVGLGLFLAAV